MTAGPGQLPRKPPVPRWGLSSLHSNLAYVYMILSIGTVLPYVANLAPEISYPGSQFLYEFAKMNQ